MNLQPSGRPCPGHLFELNRLCCNGADKIREKVEDILREKATEKADASMSDDNAMLLALQLLEWAKEGYTKELEFAFQNIEVADLLPALIDTHQKKLCSRLFNSGELEKILLRRGEGAESSLTLSHEDASKNFPSTYLRA